VNIPAGTRLGHYEILAGIGAGGMGQVYRARDTRLDRIVAVKVLPDSFASNAQLRSRFEREAKVISSLSHPNICTLHDVGTQDGIDFLVMEHLEGETLADRIARGPMALGDVFRYAIEIAEALTRAHRVGVVHRDLKPSNIMITRLGAKLLDFGLAKVAKQGSNDVTEAFNGITKPKDDLTSEGSILGTYPYMSPEQLEGREADARSDLFAFGAVLYEMLTGRRAFGGKSRASVIAAILAAEPPAISSVRPVLPAGLDRLVRGCLDKDPDDRWQSAHDVKLELESLRGGAGSVDSNANPKSSLALLPWGIAAALGLVAVFALIAILRARSHTRGPTPLVASLMAPGYQFNVSDGPAVISPDGTRIVVRARREGTAVETLLVRRLDAPDFVPLQGTEGVIDPFWSPDSQQIGFFNDGKLMRMPASGGPITTICEGVADSRGATWSGDTILFSPGPSSAIQRVSASGGGKPVEVAPLDKARSEIGQWRPHFLPDGRHYVYQSLNAMQDKWGVYVADLERKTPPRLLIDAATTAIYAPPGYLLYAYSGDLYAQPFNAETREKNGAPALIAKNVEYTAQYGSPGYSTARDGSLVMQTWQGEAHSMLGAVSSDGAVTPVGVDGDNVDLSRDDTRLAIQRMDAAARAPDLWIIDLKRGTRTRLTSDVAPDIGPVWSPDGKRIAYITQLTGYHSIRIRAASPGGAVEEITRSLPGMEITDWSRDGRYLLAEVFNPETSSDIEMIDLQGDRKLKPLLATRFVENSPRFSPDGRFLCYQSNEGGQMDIYVQTFPAGDQRWQITSSGGASARWSPDGKHLYYVTPDRRLAVLGIDTSNGFDFTTPQFIGASISQDITQPAANGTLYMTLEKSSSESINLLTAWEHTLLPQNVAARGE
jgi:serine/threonine protein kinase